MSNKEIIVIFLLGSCSLLCIYSTQPVLDAIGIWAGINSSTAALTISATTLGIAIFAPFAGFISDYYNRKKIILIAISLLCLITLLGAIAWNFYILLAMRFLQGVFIPFIFSSSVAYITEKWGSHEAIKLNSIYVAGSSFGGFSGRFISGVMTEFFNGWRLSFVALSILLFFILFLTARWLSKDSSPTKVKSFNSAVKNTFIYVKDLKVLLTCFIAFALLFQQVSSFTFGAIFLASPVFHLSPTQIGLIFIIFLIPSIITPITGFIINQYGYFSTFFISSSIGILGLILCLFNSVATIILGLSLSCISVFIGQSCGTSFIAKYCKNFKSSAIGLYLTFYYLGGFFGVIISAKVYGFGSWHACVILLIAVIIISTGLSYVAWGRRKGVQLDNI